MDSLFFEKKGSLGLLFPKALHSNRVRINHDPYSATQPKGVTPLFRIE